ncbi:ABC transporter permease subunit [Pusillimonas minor]|uniref:Branched-chain amino acid ABC transporter ATP-binding protein/permease n=1 Tax=Pusillimonas minor TaxID=2697024 RepID=A0A842HS57_9BURK|nr:branched-chain amino acid ABC transporter ATP-binding protein/permease [Pusillimonas minor]MBC2769685.1 branched-chain amino acid ABC transporter ATP-binding protein/permease [Pusillimonas minor]
MNRLTLLIWLLIASVPFLPVPDFWITQANYIGLYALVVVGLVLLTGIGGLTSFGQAAFVGIGAYATAVLTTQYGFSPWLTLLAGLLITGGSAYIIGAITLRMSGHYLPLATIAWSIALYYLFGSVEGLGKYDGIANLPSIPLFGWDLDNGRAMYWLIWACLAIGCWAMLNLLNSRPGRAIRALKGGVQMAESMGVNTARMKILIFVIAALFASVSGWLFAHLQRAINPTPFGLTFSLEYVIMLVVGGIGSVWGAILGAGVVKLLQDQLQVLMPALFGTAGNFEWLVFGLILILLLRFAPDGMWPWITRLLPRKTPPPLATAPALPRRAPTAKGTALLDVQGVRKTFGGLVAVDNVSFQVKAGEVVGLIGPNGAGKSTTFNLVTGLLHANDGTVSFMGQRIETQTSRDIAAMGVARTFQHVKLIPNMTVLDNVALGAHLRADVGVVSATLHTDRRTEASILQEAAHALKRVGLEEHMYTEAGNLALGQQRLLEIARALCCDPVLLLLDEPAAGLRAFEKEALAQLLSSLRDEGMGILIVEHDMEFVMQLTDHIVVMVFGQKIAEGPPATIQTNPAVLEAYLGGVE